jgi:hypothetical protein
MHEKLKAYHLCEQCHQNKLIYHSFKSVIILLVNQSYDHLFLATCHHEEKSRVNLLYSQYTLSSCFNQELIYKLYIQTKLFNWFQNRFCLMFYLEYFEYRQNKILQKTSQNYHVQIMMLHVPHAHQKLQLNQYLNKNFLF